MKKDVADLAIFGGEPLFSEIRPIGQLARGDRAKFSTYLDEIYANKRFTNNGPLVIELENRLAALHEVEYCVTLGNASLGLILVMDLLAQGKKGEVLMSAFTYPGLPHLAVWAGQQPRFCEVDPVTHTVDPVSVRESITDQTTSILGVHHFNSACDIDALAAIQADTGVPVFYDSVHGVESTYKGSKIGRFGLVEIFSLHATKLINGFEGGYATTNDASVAYELRRRRNFGIDPKTVQPEVLGLNAKLNEFHAAMALCSLDDLSGVIVRNKTRFEAYAKGVESLDDIDIVNYAPDEQHNYEFAIFEVLDSSGVSRDQLVEILRAENALARRYYSPPLHLDQNFADCVPDNGLPLTEELAKRFIQMPVGERLQVKDIEQIIGLFKFLENNAGAIANRFEAT